MATSIFSITIRPRVGDMWPVAVEQRTGTGFLPMSVQGQLLLNSDELRALELEPAAYGARLGAALFAAQVRELFTVALGQSPGPLRLLLTVEAPDLATLAWEHLCAPVDGAWRPLALNQRVIFARNVASLVSRAFAPVPSQQLRALILTASPADLARYQLDQFDAAGALSALHAALGSISTTLLGPRPLGCAAPSLGTLCHALSQKPHHILHLTCHGRVMPDSGETVLYLAREGRPEETAPVTGTELLARLDLLGPALPQVIFFSSCSTAHRLQDAPLRGLAQRLVSELGIPAVVAMAAPITVNTANQLATAFYQRLIVHGEPDRALAEAGAGLAGRNDSRVPLLLSRLEGASIFAAPAPSLPSPAAVHAESNAARRDTFFKRWVNELSHLPPGIASHTRSLIGSLTAALGAEVGGIVLRQENYWHPAPINEHALLPIVNVPFVQEQLDRAATQPNVCRIQPYRGRGGMLGVPFGGTSPTGFLVFTGLESWAIDDAGIRLALETVLTATDNLSVTVDRATLELRVYHELRQHLGPVSDAIYQRQFELFAQRLRETTIYFEPIVYLHPNNPYVWGWEAQLRDSVTQEEPTDLAAIAGVWGPRFQVEHDLHRLMSAADQFVQEECTDQPPRRRRKSELARLFVDVHPATLIRTAYHNAVRQIYLTGHLPGNKLTLQLSARRELPELRSGEPSRDQYTLLRDHLARYKHLDVTFALSNVGADSPSLDRLLQLGINAVKIEHSSLTYRLNQATRRYETNALFGLPEHIHVIVAGFHHDDLFPLQALFDRHIHYVQGAGIARAMLVANRIPRGTIDRIRAALGEPSRDRP